MNRRDFMEGVLGGVAAAKLRGPILAGRAAGTTQDSPLKQGSWIEQGIIDAGGDHEPLLFVTRRGGQCLDAQLNYCRQQSEELIRRLHSQGVEVFHTHLYKGFGMAAEQPEMEDTVRTAALVHRLGMKIDTYIQWSSMMYETFFAEEPRAQEWIQRDALGHPIMLWYGDQQSFRYLPCFSNQQYLEYLKKVVRYAVVEVKTDFIHFDNFALSAEPYSCHCSHCTSGFRDRLRMKYSPQQRRERLGFENVDFVNPPLWNAFNPPQQLDVVSDPVFQEWIDYRCQSMTNALKQITDLVGSLNAGVAIEINCAGITGDNTPWTRGVDHSRLLKLTQAFVDEADQPPQYMPDGRFISTIRTYKTARALRNIALPTNLIDATAIGEALAFNQTIGWAGVDPLSPEMLRYISFYRNHRSLYVGTRDVASVAILRSFPSITYHNSAAGLSAILVEQALIQARIPFDLIFDENLSHLSTSGYKLLVLPNSECLSDEQLAAIESYVYSGGGLLVTEQAGLYDCWRRKRVTPGLRMLASCQLPAPTLSAQLPMAPPQSNLPVQKEFGHGRVIYFPKLEFDGAIPPAEPYFVIGPEFWKRPANWKELVRAAYWAAQDEIPLRVSGPDFLAANLVEQSGNRRRLVHLVNYNAKEIPVLEDIQVQCALPGGQTVTEVRLYSADLEMPLALSFRMQGADVLFTIPKLNTYCVATVSW